MNKLKLLKNKYGCYESENKIINEKLNIIHILLGYYSCDFKSLLKWLEKSDYPKMYSNICLFEKQNGEIILTIQNSFKNKKPFPMFKTKKEYFINMIEKWLQIRKIKPKKVVIKLDDDGKVTLEYDEK